MYADIFNTVPDLEESLGFRPKSPFELLGNHKVMWRMVWDKFKNSYK